MKQPRLTIFLLRDKANVPANRGVPNLGIIASHAKSLACSLCSRQLSIDQYLHHAKEQNFTFRADQFPRADVYRLKSISRTGSLRCYHFSRDVDLFLSLVDPALHMARLLIFNCIFPTFLSISLPSLIRDDPTRSTVGRGGTVGKVVPYPKARAHSTDMLIGQRGRRRKTQRHIYDASLMLLCQGWLTHDETMHTGEWMLIPTSQHFLIRSDIWVVQYGKVP